jgi:hypothetical protein
MATQAWWVSSFHWRRHARKAQSDFVTQFLSQQFELFRETRIELYGEFVTHGDGNMPVTSCTCTAMKLAD